MRIILDVDGILADWGKAASAAMRRRGYRIDYDEHPDWDYLRNRISKEDWRWLWSGEEGFWSNMDAYPGAADATHALAQRGHTIVIATGRPRRAEEDTMHWLAARGFCFHECHVLGENDGDVNAAASSVQAKQDIEGDLLLDDLPQALTDWQNRLHVVTPKGRRTGVLWRRRYNAHVAWSPVVSSWSEFFKIVEARE